MQLHAYCPMKFPGLYFLLIENVVTFIKQKDGSHFKSILQIIFNTSICSKHACSQSSLFLWAGNGQFFGQNFDKNLKLWSIWDKSLGLYVKCKCQWRQFECWISKLNLITLDPIKGSYNRLYIFFISQFVNWQRNH